MSKPLLIGLAGKARSGKDTVADALVAREWFCKTAFAAPLKAGVRAMFDLTTEHTDGALKETVLPHLGVSPRQLMQWLGTEYGRQLIGESVWVDVVLKQWATIQAQSRHPRLVVSDVRFDNEAQALRDAGGTIMHIFRDDADAVQSHASEAGVKIVGGDVLVDNNGTLDDLKAEVAAWVQYLGPDKSAH